MTPSHWHASIYAPLCSGPMIFCERTVLQHAENSVALALTCRTLLLPNTLFKAQSLKDEDINPAIRLHSGHGET